jgi:hypothetical protein
MMTMYVTLEDVAGAVAVLEAQGLEPSANKVRNHLGRGSKETIVKLLRQLRERDGSAPGEQTVIAKALDPAPPAPVVPADAGLEPWQRGRRGLPDGEDVRPQTTQSVPTPHAGPLAPWQMPYTPDPERPRYDVPAQANGVHGDPAEALARAEAELTRIDELFHAACDQLVQAKTVLLATKALPIAGINHGSLHPHDERHQEALDDVQVAKRQYDELWQQRDAARQALRQRQQAYRRFQQERYVADHAPQLLQQRDYWKHRADHPTSGHDEAEAKKNAGLAQQAYSYAVAQAPVDEGDQQ